MIYYGKIADKILRESLDNRSFNKHRGYFFDKNTWIAFDNTTGNCWVEEFKTEGMAICWLEHFYEISEIEEFEVLKIQRDLFFLPENGFIKVQLQNNVVTLKFYPIFSPISGEYQR